MRTARVPTSRSFLEGGSHGPGATGTVLGRHGLGALGMSTPSMFVHSFVVARPPKLIRKEWLVAGIPGKPHQDAHPTRTNDPTSHTSVSRVPSRPRGRSVKGDQTQELCDFAFRSSVFFLSFRAPRKTNKQSSGAARYEKEPQKKHTAYTLGPLDGYV